MDPYSDQLAIMELSRRKWDSGKQEAEVAVTAAPVFTHRTIKICKKETAIVNTCGVLIWLTDWRTNERKCISTVM